MIRALPRIALAFLACGCGLPAAAGTYLRTDADGSITLTNVPTGEGYIALSSEDGEPAAPAAQPAPWPASGPARGVAARRDLYDDIIEEMARLHRLDGALLHAVVAVESAYEARAQSPKGAGGLMQLMPATARRYGVTDVLDPRQNLEAGARYLSDLLQLFDADLSLALAAYNAGENRVLRNGRRVPRIRETLDYVPKVMDLYQRYRTQGRAAPAGPLRRAAAGD